MKQACLQPFFMSDVIEAGCDEAGRGCLVGPVFAGAVVLSTTDDWSMLNDSKQLSAHRRAFLRELIEQKALAWSVGVVSAAEIDQINILNASILAMHRALDGLCLTPQHIIVDGNRFKPYADIPYHTVVKGDAKYCAIAAASILAKTHRDAYMLRLAHEFPGYDWEHNMGYPTKKHRAGIAALGATKHHRMSFRLLDNQQEIPFEEE